MCPHEGNICVLQIKKTLTLERAIGCSSGRIKATEHICSSYICGFKKAIYVLIKARYVLKKNKKTSTSERAMGLKRVSSKAATDAYLLTPFFFSRIHLFFSFFYGCV